MKEIGVFEYYVGQLIPFYNVKEISEGKESIFELAHSLLQEGEEFLKKREALKRRGELIFPSQSSASKGKITFFDDEKCLLSYGEREYFLLESPQNLNSIVERFSREEWWIGDVSFGDNILELTFVKSGTALTKTLEFEYEIAYDTRSFVISLLEKNYVLRRTGEGEILLKNMLHDDLYIIAKENHKGFTEDLIEDMVKNDGKFFKFYIEFENLYVKKSDGRGNTLSIYHFHIS